MVFGQRAGHGTLVPLRVIAPTSSNFETLAKKVVFSSFWFFASLTFKKAPLLHFAMGASASKQASRQLVEACTSLDTVQDIGELALLFRKAVNGARLCCACVRSVILVIFCLGKTPILDFNSPFSSLQVAVTSPLLPPCPPLLRSAHAQSPTKRCVHHSCYERFFFGRNVKSSKQLLFIILTSTQQPFPSFNHNRASSPTRSRWPQPSRSRPSSAPRCSPSRRRRGWGRTKKTTRRVYRAGVSLSRS